MNKNMNLKVVFVCVFVFVCLVSLAGMPSVKSQSAGAIFINSDGSVSGATNIQRDGNLYRLTANLYDSPIVVLRNNIVIDGEGFVLQGAGGWGPPGVAGLEATSAINLTCSNVTVRNFIINGWEVGILGSYNGNTITNNNITATERATAIYADNYNVTGNYLANSIYGVRIQVNNNSIQQNQIVNNYYGFLISYSSGVTIAGNNIANNNIAVNTDNMPPSNFQIYLNNFIIGANATIVSVTSDALGFGGGGTLSPWDNGTIGNYWSDYTTKYSNATEIDHTGIGDTPYLIRVNPTIIDRYPLITPVSVQSITLPSSSSSPSQTTSPSSMPSPSPASSPSWSYSMLELITLTAVLVIAMASCMAVLVFRKRGVSTSRNASAKSNSQFP
jgi:parallel beta-helix repeat protein